jgi:hypothetical protein
MLHFEHSQLHWNFNVESIDNEGRGAGNKEYNVIVSIEWYTFFP